MKDSNAREAIDDLRRTISYMKVVARGEENKTKSLERRLDHMDIILDLLLDFLGVKVKQLPSRFILEVKDDE